MKPSHPPRARLWLIAGLALPVLLLGGCYSRKEAVLVTNRLGSASEETGKLVAQMKASDAANAFAAVSNDSPPRGETPSRTRSASATPCPLRPAVPGPLVVADGRVALTRSTT